MAFAPPPRVSLSFARSKMRSQRWWLTTPSTHSHCYIALKKSVYACRKVFLFSLSSHSPRHAQTSASVSSQKRKEKSLLYYYLSLAVTSTEIFNLLVDDIFRYFFSTNDIVSESQTDVSLLIHFIQVFQIKFDERNNKSFLFRILVVKHSTDDSICHRLVVLLSSLLFSSSSPSEVNVVTISFSYSWPFKQLREKGSRRLLTLSLAGSGCCDDIFSVALWNWSLVTRQRWVMSLLMG